MIEEPLKRVCPGGQCSAYKLPLSAEDVNFSSDLLYFSTRHRQGVFYFLIGEYPFTSWKSSKLNIGYPLNRIYNLTVNCTFSTIGNNVIPMSTSLRLAAGSPYTPRGIVKLTLYSKNKSTKGGLWGRLLLCDTKTMPVYN